jgi:ferritin-like metal-binding protein YciE
MEKLKNLKDLLNHEILDLYSAEEQIIAALPKMIEKAKNPSLKAALEEHLSITEQQKNRLDEVKTKLEMEMESENTEGGEKRGFLFGLFGGSDNGQTCKGMMGLIDEGEKIMNEEMNPEVLDAAIIASAQKIEHYEICGYGTARAYARELNLKEVAQLLEQTLNEEYEADDRLTDMAVGGLNEKAESAGRARRRRSGQGRSQSKSSGRGGKSAKNSSNVSSKVASKTGRKAPAKKSSGSSNRTASKSSSARPSSARSSSARSSSTGGNKKAGGSSKKSAVASGRSSKKAVAKKAQPAKTARRRNR